MEQNEILKEILELDKYLSIQNELYYVKHEPVISDEAYDAKLVQLRDLVGKYKGDVKTILDKPGSDLIGTDGTVKHIRPMISLRTEVDSSYVPLEAFLDRCKKEFPDRELEYVDEPKFDGLAMSLRYHPDGSLQMAVTRGDGEVGEVFTHNVSQIPNIKNSLKTPPFMLVQEVRGEIVLLKAEFDKVNEYRIRDKEKPFVNCRNAVAGIIRKSNQKPEYLQALKFIPYSMYGEGLPETQATILEYLYVAFNHKEPGYRHPVLTEIELGEAMKFYSKIREDLPYEIDGVVYKLNRIEDQEQFGVSGREPRWAMAHKLPAEQRDTILEAIDIQVGPSGRLTPVARVRPVFVGGTTVSNVTLSNLFQVRKKGVRVGDLVTLQRAGDVIPEIVGVSSKRQTYVPNFKMPKQCPVCSGEVVREKGKSNHHCIATITCPSQAYGVFAGNAARDMLDIEGLAEATSQKLYESGFDSFDELFDMDHPGWDIANLGKVVTSNLKGRLIATAHKPIGSDMFLKLLNIHNLGNSSSKKIAAYVGDFETFLVTDPDEYKMVDVPKHVVKNIKKFLASELAIQRANKLYKILSVVKYEKNLDGVLASKKIVLSGSPEKISKTGYSKYLTDMGAEIVGSVSKKTDILIYGEGSGSKLEKAKELKIQHFTYEEFASMYNINV